MESEDQFKKNWDEFTKGVFKDMDWSNVFCAGGAILANLLSGLQTKQLYAESDLDLFIYGCTPEQASIKLKHIHEVLTRNSGGGGNVIRTRRTVTLLHTYPFRHTQVILKIYKSPAEILLGFDIDSCCCKFSHILIFLNLNFSLLTPFFFFTHKSNFKPKMVSMEVTFTQWKEEEDQL